MFAPEFFEKADAPVKVALIAAFASLATSLLTAAHSLFGAPVKYWLEKKALRNKLATEYEYEQRKNLRALIGKYQGRMLEAAETLNHRMWNLYINQDKGWLDAHGHYEKSGYYHFSFVYRFLGFFSLARQFESEAVLIDSRIAEKNDLDFVKFVKAFNWAACDVALFDNLNYDANYATDHFFRDQLRETCDSCTRDGIFLDHEELRSALSSTSGFDAVFRFFDGLKRDERRSRWDRLVTIHLLLMAFVNNFGYDMQESTRQQFVEVASQANSVEVLRNLDSWLPRLGLANNRPAHSITMAIEAVLTRDPCRTQATTA